jgi:long-chain fatty acid transport protein
LQENSASGLGNAFAGGAAVAEDASTVWWNPAGMSRLRQGEAVLAVHFILPSNKFSDNGSQAALNQPLGTSAGGDAGGLIVVPNLYVVVPYNRQVAFGLGINVPFGLTTEYDDGWIGRYQSINVQPSLSWRVNDQWSLGFGIDWQWLSARLTSDANYSGAIAQGAGQAAAAGQIPPSVIPAILASTRGLDSRVTVKGDDSALGYNVGALWELVPDTRFGIHFRSKFKYDVRGDVDFNQPTVGPVPTQLAVPINAIASGVSRALYNGDVHSEVTLPQSINLSAFHRINERWDVMVDLQWTGWSSIQDLTFVRDEGPVLSSTPYNFKDTWRVSVGGNYRASEQWMLRGGIAFDQSPANDRDRTPRLPDADRTWFAVGAQYKHSPQLIVDAGFAYMYVDDATIDTNAGSTAQYGLLRGSYESHVAIFSIQGAIRF